MMDVEVTTGEAESAASLLNPAVWCMDGMLQGWSLDELADRTGADRGEIRGEVDAAMIELARLQAAFAAAALQAGPAERH